MSFGPPVRDPIHGPMLDVRWVVTFFPSDGPVAHALCDDETQARTLIVQFEAFLKRPMTPESYRIEAVPATWDCDGRDGCTVAA